MGEWEHDLQHEFTDEDEPHPYTGKRPSEMKGWEGPDWRVDDNYNGLEVGEPEPGEEVPEYSVDEDWAAMWDAHYRMSDPIQQIIDADREQEYYRQVNPHG